MYVSTKLPNKAKPFHNVVNIIMNVYAPAWFWIKSHPNASDGALNPSSLHHFSVFFHVIYKLLSTVYFWSQRSLLARPPGVSTHHYVRLCRRLYRRPITVGQVVVGHTFQMLAFWFRYTWHLSNSFTASF